MSQSEHTREMIVWTFSALERRLLRDHVVKVLSGIVVASLRTVKRLYGTLMLRYRKFRLGKLAPVKCENIL